MRGSIIVLLASLLLAPGMARSADESSARGRILVALGSCEPARLDGRVLKAFPPTNLMAGLRFRREGGGGIFLSGLTRSRFTAKRPEYAEDDNRYVIETAWLEPGDWEVFNHEQSFIKSSDSRHETKLVFRSPTNYSYRFRVEPGKLTDLGRFCGAGQFQGFLAKVSGGREIVVQGEATAAYLLVSVSRREDIEDARRRDVAAPMEVIDAVPKSPGAVTPLWRTSRLEPRLIMTDPPPRPCPTEPVQPCPN